MRDSKKKLSLDKYTRWTQPRRSDRKYRPWTWEMHGGRFWPWLTIERHINEELRLRHDPKMPHRRPLWPADDIVLGRPTVFALQTPYDPPCVVHVRETCAAERPLVCPTPPDKPYINYANWQWLPHSLSSVAYSARNK